MFEYAKASQVCVSVSACALWHSQVCCSTATELQSWLRNAEQEEQASFNSSPVRTAQSRNARGEQVETHRPHRGRGASAHATHPFKTHHIPPFSVCQQERKKQHGAANVVSARM